MWKIRQRVQSLSRLTTLPQIATRVLELVENPRTSASQLGEIIASDQVLTARILKLANSAYFGFPRRISTLNLAIVVLGFNALRDLVLSISIIDQFRVNADHGLDLEKFWRHSVIVAIGAKVLSRMGGYAPAGEVFVGGLIHDIGYLVLVQHFPHLFQEAFNYAQERSISFLEAEYRTLGFSHAEVGAWLAQGWNLPEKLVKAIQYHHQPQRVREKSEFVWFIHLADLISHSLSEGGGFDQLAECPMPEINGQLKKVFRNPQPLEFYQEAILQESQKAEEFLEALLSRTTTAQKTTEIS